MNIRLRPRLLNLKPGTRIVANTFGLGHWNADRTVTIPGDCRRWCFARLWIVPAKVGGTWKMREGRMRLNQAYQTFSGTLEGPDGPALIAGRLRAEEIFFGAGKTRFTGRVEGGVIKGIARSGGKDTPFQATRIGD